MEEGHDSSSGRLTLFRAGDLADAARRFNLGPRRGAERMHANVQFPFQLAVAENLDAGPGAVRQADRPQRCFIHSCAVFESVERFNAHWNIAGRVTRIVETALRHAPDQWHLAAFKTDADRAAGPRRLDRKSTRLNSSHVSISYAVFCLKKKKVLHIFLSYVLNIIT